MTPDNKLKLSQLGEFGLIDRFKNKLRGTSSVVIQGIGDDCAVYKASKDRYQIVTTDALVEGVHFNLKFHPPELLGRKSLAVSLSDIAAMGGSPRTAVISLGIPETLPLNFLDKFYNGLHNMGEEFDLSISGGDTVKSPKGLWISLTVIGEVRKNRIFKRAGAKAGHSLLVTGTLGDSALGLKLLSAKGKPLKVSSESRKKLVARHLDPTPRLSFSKALAASKIRVSSMIDISDGLQQDLSHICRMSGVGADIEPDHLPLSREFKNLNKNNSLKHSSLCLTGGEDYELLFTTPPEDVKKLKKITMKVGVPVTQIGRMTPTAGCIRHLENDGSSEIQKITSGFDHFR